VGHRKEAIKAKGPGEVKDNDVETGKEKKNTGEDLQGWGAEYANPPY